MQKYLINQTLFIKHSIFLFINYQNLNFKSIEIYFLIDFSGVSRL